MKIRLPPASIAGSARCMTVTWTPLPKPFAALPMPGDSPQQEAALYYLAQIALVHNDPTTARHYLARTIALRGDFERRAVLS